MQWVRSKQQFASLRADAVDTLNYSLLPFLDFFTNIISLTAEVSCVYIAFSH